MEFEIKIFEKPEKDLEIFWSQLETNGNFYVFQSYDWFKNWYEVYFNKNKNLHLRVAVIKYKSNIICILPFQIEKKLALNILTWAGDKELDYCSPILNEKFSFNEKNFNKMLDKVFLKIGRIDILKLLRQPKKINNLANPFTLYLPTYYDSKNYCISLPVKWKDYENTVLKKDFKSQNKRKKNALKRSGKLKFKIFKNKNEIVETLEDLFKQKNMRLSLQKSKTLFQKSDYDFYSSICKSEKKNFQVHLSSLKLNNKILAMHLGVIHKRRFYYLILSMGDEFGKFSPGRILISLLIKWSISKKLKFFDFTLGDESYKKSWSNLSSEYFNHVSSRSFLGLIFVFLFKLKYLIKNYDKNKKFINIIKMIKD